MPWKSCLISGAAYCAPCLNSDDDCTSTSIPQQTHTSAYAYTYIHIYVYNDLMGLGCLLSYGERRSGCPLLPHQEIDNNGLYCLLTR